MEITRMLRVLCTAAFISPQVVLNGIVPLQFASAAVNQRNYASKGQFPHHVAIILDDTSPCSGTLIKEQWVLTVAQCVDNAVKWTVYAGTNNMQSASEEGRQILTTRRAYPTPGYNFPEYDLALLKTPTKFQLSTHVKPAALPSSLDSITVGGSATVTGYHVPGSTTESESNILWYIDDLKIVERTECDKAFGRTFKYNHICVAGTDDLIISEGDLGSPLLSRNKAGELTPIGVASIVSQPVSSLSTGKGTHFVFFSVPDVVPWIKWATDSSNWNVYNEE